MSIEGDVVTAIAARFTGGAWLNEFPQPPARPTWPAARVSVPSVSPDVALCGDGGEETADVRIQIDVVVDESAGYSALKTLQAQVMSDMTSFDPPAVWDNAQFTFDAETKTHRCILDYLIYPSSLPESP